MWKREARRSRQYPSIRAVGFCQIMWAPSMGYRGHNANRLRALGVTRQDNVVIVPALRTPKPALLYTVAANRMLPSKSWPDDGRTGLGGLMGNQRSSRLPGHFRVPRLQGVGWRYRETHVVDGWCNAILLSRRRPSTLVSHTAPCPGYHRASESTSTGDAGGQLLKIAGC